MKLTCRLMLIFTIAVVLLSAGCGTSAPCDFTGLTITPATATLNHTAASPANMQQFVATGQLPSGCSQVAQAAAMRRDVTWSVSNQTAAQISNVNDATYGFATCVNASATPITVTATLEAAKNNGKQVTGTASLTCQ